MHKAIWITALSLTVTGILIVAGALFAMNFDFRKLDTHEYISETYTIDEAFSTISADIDTTDIQFLPSDSEECRVECEDMTKSDLITVKVRDGKLHITQEDNRKWYEYIGINLRSPKVIVYLPHANCDLDVKGSTGNVTVAKELSFSDINIKISTGKIQCDAQVGTNLKLESTTGSIICRGTGAEKVHLKASTGKIQVENQECDTLEIKTSTGSIRVENCTASEMRVNASTGDVRIRDTYHNKLTVKTSTGDVRFENCEGSNLKIDTSSGDVTGSFRGPMMFICDTSTGDIDVDSSSSGGRCEITTSTGDIEMTTN